jgi:siroheme synthase
LTVVTGHTCDAADTALDWQVLARAETLVILMGLRRLAGITAQLLAHGRAPDTPVAVVQWGTTAEQIVVEGTLADIAEKAYELESPATIVVGQVVSLRQQLQWFDPGLGEPRTTQSEAALPYAVPVELPAALVCP